MLIIAGWAAGALQYVEPRRPPRLAAAFDKVTELSEQNKHARGYCLSPDLAARAPSGYRILARLRTGHRSGEPDPQGRRQECSIAADRKSVGTAEQGSGADFARRNDCWNIDYPNMLQRLEPPPRRLRLRHTLANCWPCRLARHDATPARKCSTLIANDGETPRACVRARSLARPLPPVAKS